MPFTTTTLTTETAFTEVALTASTSFSTTTLTASTDFDNIGNEWDEAAELTAGAWESWEEKWEDIE